MTTMLQTVVSGLALGLALLFGLFLVAGGQLPNGPLTGMAFILGMFLSWVVGRSAKRSRSRRARRSAIRQQ